MMRLARVSIRRCLRAERAGNNQCITRIWPCSQQTARVGRSLTTAHRGDKRGRSKPVKPSNASNNTQSSLSFEKMQAIFKNSVEVESPSERSHVSSSGAGPGLTAQSAELDVLSLDSLENEPPIGNQQELEDMATALFEDATEEVLLDAHTSYHARMDVAIARGNNESLLEIERDMRQEGVQFLRSTYEKLIAAYCDAGLHPKVLRLRQEMDKASSTTTKDIEVCLLRSLSSLGKFVTVLRVLERMILAHVPVPAEDIRNIFCSLLDHERTPLDRRLVLSLHLIRMVTQLKQSFSDEQYQEMLLLMADRFSSMDPPHSFGVKSVVATLMTENVSVPIEFLRKMLNRFMETRDGPMAWLFLDQLHRLGEYVEPDTYWDLANMQSLRRSPAAVMKLLMWCHQSGESNIGHVANLVVRSLSMGVPGAVQPQVMGRAFMEIDRLASSKLHVEEFTFFHLAFGFADFLSPLNTAVKNPFKEFQEHFNQVAVMMKADRRDIVAAARILGHALSGMTATAFATLNLFDEHPFRGKAPLSSQLVMDVVAYNALIGCNHLDSALSVRKFYERTADAKWSAWLVGEYIRAFISAGRVAEAFLEYKKAVARKLSVPPGTTLDVILALRHIAGKGSAAFYSSSSVDTMLEEMRQLAAQSVWNHSTLYRRSIEWALSGDVESDAGPVTSWWDRQKFWEEEELLWQEMRSATGFEPSTSTRDTGVDRDVLYGMFLPAELGSLIVRSEQHVHSSLQSDAVPTRIKYAALLHQKRLSVLKEEYAHQTAHLTQELRSRHLGGLSDLPTVAGVVSAPVEPVYALEQARERGGQDTSARDTALKRLLSQEIVYASQQSVVPHSESCHHMGLLPILSLFQLHAYKHNRDASIGIDLDGNGKGLSFDFFLLSMQMQRLGSEYRHSPSSAALADVSNMDPASIAKMRSLFQEDGANGPKGDQKQFLSKHLLELDMNCGPDEDTDYDHEVPELLKWWEHMEVADAARDRFEDSSYDAEYRSPLAAKGVA